MNHYIVVLLILVFVTPPTRASAQQYATRRTGETVALEDMKNHTAVTILPSVGNIAFSMKVNGQETLRWPYASLEEFKARPALSGIPFLGPWANRLDEQAFYANGKKYAFDMDLGNVRGAIPIHGFLSTGDQWQVVEVKADAKSAWMTSRLDFFKQPMWMKQFPFAHTIEMTYRLQDGVLQVMTKITNMSAEPMPVAVGFHPYFKLTDSTREEWTISVGARTHWKLATTKIPTGETEPIAQDRAHMVVKGKHQQLDVIVDPNWRAIVIFSPNPNPTGGRGQGGQSDPNFIAIEPMAGITDAMNLAHKGLYKELQSIPPGGNWAASFWVKPSGF